MTKERTFQILEGLPQYEDLPVIISPGNKPYYSVGLVIRFFRIDGTSWVANFQPGWTDLNAVHELPSLNGLIVIAGGNCYIINPEQAIHAPRSTFTADYEAVYKASDGTLVLQGSTNFTIINANGDIWHSERISYDGFNSIILIGDVISGLSYAPGDVWIPFSLNIKTRIVTGGSFIGDEYIR